MRKRVWTGIAVLLLAFVLGCSQNAATESAETESTAPPDVPAAAERQESPANTAAYEGEGTAEAPDDDDKNHISVASPAPETLEPENADDLYMNEEDRAQMTAAQEARQDFNRRSYDVTGTFDPERPTLMGVAVGSDAEAVTGRFGEPTESYSLPDETVKASVQVYPGFAIGIRDKKVLFVEVSTRSVNPGLNGLRLGDTRDNAAKKLGQPAAESEFLMTYKAGGVVLKLDLDPDTGKIHSIKLFPEE